MINHKRKFIYTKIYKTASQSILHTLMKSQPGQQPKGSGHYHLLDEINPRTEDYFKFTFVRNPWARLVSRYFYIRQLMRQDRHRPSIHKNYSKGKSTFAEFAKSKGPPYEPDDERKFYRQDANPYGALQQRVGAGRPNLQRLFNQKHPYDNQLDWISDDNGVVLTDFIGKVENLQKDFNTVCDKIGMKRRKVPHKNKTRHKHYTKYYDDETREIVAEKFARDIEYFGYEFGK